MNINSNNLLFSLEQITAWTREEVKQWAENTFGDESPIADYLFKAFITGRELLFLTEDFIQKDKKTKPQLEPGLIMALIREIKALGGSDEANSSIVYKPKLNFQKEECISTLYNFEKFL